MWKKRNYAAKENITKCSSVAPIFLQPSHIDANTNAYVHARWACIGGALLIDVPCTPSIMYMQVYTAIARYHDSNLFRSRALGAIKVPLFLSGGRIPAVRFTSQKLQVYMLFPHVGAKKKKEKKKTKRREETARTAGVIFATHASCLSWQNKRQ